MDCACAAKPASQTSQTVAALVLEKVPAAHGKHMTLRIWSEYWPGWHSLQADMLLAFEKLPALQFKHSANPAAGLYLPSMHTGHS